VDYINRQQTPVKDVNRKMSRSTCAKRKANFGKLEETQIVENVNMRSDILFGRFSLNLTSEKKAKAWQEVTEAVNA